MIRLVLLGLGIILSVLLAETGILDPKSMLSIGSRSWGTLGYVYGFVVKGGVVMKKSIFLGVVVVLLFGCVSTKDYSIVLGKGGVIDHDAMISLTGESYDWLEPHAGGKYIHIPFGVSSKFIRYFLENDVNINVSYFFCDRLDVEVWAGLSGLYMAGKSLTDRKYSGESILIGVEEKDMILLDLILFSSWDGHKTAIQSYDFGPYDLLSEPRDVCVKVRAAGLVSGVESEVVRIPMASIGYL